VEGGRRYLRIEGRLLAFTINHNDCPYADNHKFKSKALYSQNPRKFPDVKPALILNRIWLRTGQNLFLEANKINKKKKLSAKINGF
jgi:hypothetical protein